MKVKAYTGDFTEFVKAAKLPDGRAMIEVLVIEGKRDGSNLLAGVIKGDPMSLCIHAVLGATIRAMVERKFQPLCVGCDREMGPHEALAPAFLLIKATDEKHWLATPYCHVCVDSGGDLWDMGMRLVHRMFADVHEITRYSGMIQ